jgi:phage shock protein A
MGILDRMSRVMASNFNALLDQAEDPAKSLAQTLRDMQTQLRLAKAELVRAVAAERQLKRKAEELGEQVALWEKRAELAVERGDDALAREALLQRRRAQTEQQRTEQLRAQQRGNALDMKSAWDSMQQKFRDFSSRQNIIAARATQAKGGGGVEALGGNSGAFEEFRAIEERIDGVDDVLDAQREVDQALAASGSAMGLAPHELELKFQQLEGSMRQDNTASTELDSELLELKQKLRVRVE